MKNIHVALAAGTACICIAVAVFYITPDKPNAGDIVQSLQERLGESERIIAELRGRELADSASNATREDRFPAQAANTDSSRPDSANLAAAQARLEDLATRMELRLAQLEKQMKSSHLIPLTREELDAEIEQAQKTLAEMQQRVDAQDAEVRRLALALGVPAVVAQLSPWEAIKNPAYRPYRAYFEAKMKAGYLQMYAKEQGQKIFGLQLLCSR